jgi:hypothetical protein
MPPLCSNHQVVPGQQIPLDCYVRLQISTVGPATIVRRWME